MTTPPLYMSEATEQRRQKTRRHGERRQNPYPFNSPEWVEYMRENFELWPKQDRRKGERRNADRRQRERRGNNRRLMKASARLRQREALSAQNILDEEEVMMIRDLYDENNT